jgi:multimeric flavodoxin WrbA
MKIIGFVGSGREDGSTSVIVKTILDAAKGNGHATKLVNLCKIDLKNCAACYFCKDKNPVKCARGDDFAKMIPQIAKADCLVIGTPIYFGHVSGPTKTFIDRWFAFFDSEKFVSKLPEGKKVILVTTSGSTPEYYKKIPEYLKGIFVKFFGMKLAGEIAVGEVGSAEDLKKKSAVLKKAEKLGKSL